MTTFAEELHDMYSQINLMQATQAMRDAAEIKLREAEYQRWLAHNPVIDEIERVTK